MHAAHQCWSQADTRAHHRAPLHQTPHLIHSSAGDNKVTADAGEQLTTVMMMMMWGSLNEVKPIGCVCGAGECHSPAAPGVWQSARMKNWAHSLINRCCLAWSSTLTSVRSVYHLQHQMMFTKCNVLDIHINITIIHKQSTQLQSIN